MTSVTQQGWSQCLFPGSPRSPSYSPHSVLQISSPPGAFKQVSPSKGDSQDRKRSPGCTAISHRTEEEHKRPGPGWPGEQRCGPLSGHKVSLWLPRSGGHAPASGDLGVTHRGQWRAGTFCDFPRGILDSGSHPASQAARSMGKQGHHPSQEEGLRVCRHTAKSETRKEARLHHQGARLKLSGSPFPHLFNGKQRFLTTWARGSGQKPWLLLLDAPQSCGLSQPTAVLTPRHGETPTRSHSKHQTLQGHSAFPHPISWS